MGCFVVFGLLACFWAWPDSNPYFSPSPKPSPTGRGVIRAVHPIPLSIAQTMGIRANFGGMSAELRVVSRERKWVKLATLLTLYSMPEMAHTGENHGEPCVIRAPNHVINLDRSARLNDGGCARRGRR